MIFHTCCLAKVTLTWRNYYHDCTKCKRKVFYFLFNLFSCFPETFFYTASLSHFRGSLYSVSLQISGKRGKLRTSTSKRKLNTFLCIWYSRDNNFAKSGLPWLNNTCGISFYLSSKIRTNKTISNLQEKYGLVVNVTMFTAKNV